MPNQTIKTVSIIGGGASAHTLIPFLSGAGHRVQLLTRRPGDWSETVELQLQAAGGELLRTFSGSLARVSSEPAELIPSSDVVVLCMPVHQYRRALAAIAPHLPRDRVEIRTTKRSNWDSRRSRPTCAHSTSGSPRWRRRSGANR